MLQLLLSPVCMNVVGFVALDAPDKITAKLNWLAAGLAVCRSLACHTRLILKATVVVAWFCWASLFSLARRVVVFGWGGAGSGQKVDYFSGRGYLRRRVPVYLRRRQRRLNWLDLQRILISNRFAIPYGRGGLACGNGGVSVCAIAVI